MSYEVKILADSKSPEGKRLTTFELTYPRMVHAEFMTHRMFSRNSASSRAIPIEKMIQRVKDDPVMPVWWGKNQSGMQAKEELEGECLEAAQRNWLTARNKAIEMAEHMTDVGLHKQIANRLLEPWMWITVICSATEYQNFFHLRCHPDAQPEIQKLAYMMRDAYDESAPYPLSYGEWHLPLVTLEERSQAVSDVEAMDILLKVSAGRCARVSYLTHDGKRDMQADVDLCDRLAAAGHMSPFEHVATPSEHPQDWANFIGWRQYRRFIPNENKG